jgi:hypothetical protein
MCTTGWPTYFLDHVARLRRFHARDPKDKIYALVHLWGLALAPDVAANMSSRHFTDPFLVIDYSMSVAEFYKYFATWSIVKSNSLEILRHGGGGHLRTYSSEEQYSWVPDWSSTHQPILLPARIHSKHTSIPWWSVPTKQSDGSNEYTHNAAEREHTAREILKKHHSLGSSCNPERSFDAMFPDEAGGRRLECRRTERQCNFLEPLVRDGVGEVDLYSAAGLHSAEFNFTADSLEVQGIFVEKVSDTHEPFVAELESDWKNSTRFLVSIGEVKKTALKSVTASRRYIPYFARSLAFWSTILVGQPFEQGSHVETWLPRIPKSWYYETPPLTVLYPGQLEFIEAILLVERCLESFSKGGAYGLATGASWAESGKLEPSEWTNAELTKYRSEFDEAGMLWKRQRYDLYHHPFDLPFVVPDPYWECRRKWDKVARKESFEHRHSSQEITIAGTNGPMREATDQFPRRLTAGIKKEPSIVPRILHVAGIEKYALGRRFFITESGRYGLGPPDTQEGDVVAVVFGLSVPLVLRRAENGHYRVVGESYVHGIMKGEMIEQYELGMQEMRTIKLC